MSTGLAIVGYGRMGRLIEELRRPEYGFDVAREIHRAKTICTMPASTGIR